MFEQIWQIAAKSVPPSLCVLWYGMVCCCVVDRGVVLCCVLWCGLMWCGMVCVGVQWPIVYQQPILYERVHENTYPIRGLCKASIVYESK